MPESKAAVYLRVSSKDGRQDEANQEPDCQRLCEARGFEPIFYRERESGAKRRPEWERVIEAARTGIVHAVVFWSVDRIGRTRVEIMKDLWNLTRFGVAIVSCRERVVDVPRADAATSPLLIIVREQAIAWLTFAAEDERTKLIERTRAGIARARALGKHVGRPPVDPLKLARGISLVEGGGVSIYAAARTVGVAHGTLKAAISKKAAGGRAA